MGELKDARQIARERAERLGSLSPDEQRQQQIRERSQQAGAALARSWLAGDEAVDLAAELESRTGDEKAMLRQTLLRHLLEAADLSPERDPAAARRAIEGMSIADPEPGGDADELRRLVSECEEAERKAQSEFESASMEALHRMRISGTALGGINVRALPGWQESRLKLIADCRPVLDRLKQRIA